MAPVNFNMKKGDPLKVHYNACFVIPEKKKDARTKI
jgi:hypothetical protein